MVVVVVVVVVEEEEVPANRDRPFLYPPLLSQVSALAPSYHEQSMHPQQPQQQQRHPSQDAYPGPEEGTAGPDDLGVEGGGEQTTADVIAASDHHLRPRRHEGAEEDEYAAAADSRDETGVASGAEGGQMAAQRPPHLRLPSPSHEPSSVDDKIRTMTDGDGVGEGGGPAVPSDATTTATADGGEGGEER